jgi:hypothetical protein
MIDPAIVLPKLDRVAAMAPGVLPKPHPKLVN